MALFIVAFMNINTFAAVSGNDGSAFVTKAEYDALINTFNEQMDNYENSIVSKIDGAIANYLASLSSYRHVEIVTGFDIETAGKTAKAVRFIKNNNNFFSMNNNLRGNDTIYTSAIGTYAQFTAFEQDNADTLLYTSTNNYGSNDNFLALIDTNALVKEFKANCKIDINRNLIFYSITDANNGLNWTKVTSNYALPTGLYSNEGVYANSITATGRAFRRTSGTSAPDSIHTNKSPQQVYATNNYNTSTQTASNYAKLDTFQDMYFSANSHSQALTYVSRGTIVNFTGTNFTSYAEHWPLGSSYNVKTSDKEWGKVEMLKAAYTSATDYTNTVRLRYSSGPGAYSIIWPTISTKGVGVTFDTANKSVTQIYYKNIFDNWGKKIAYGGGFPIYYTDEEEEATITIPLKLSNQATVCITDTQSTTFPADGSGTIIPFSYRPVGGNWVNVGSKSVLLGGSEFEFKFDLVKGQTAYFQAKWDTADNTMIVTQTDKAYMDTED